MKYDSIEIDTETLATTADAVILSIGAVRFNQHTDEIDDAGFYASISIESNLAVGRRISEDTLMWWMKQEPAAQQVFYDPKQTLETALNSLADWCNDTTKIVFKQGVSQALVWSNGADFDLPMLAHAYTTFGSEVPWAFYNSRCHRTMKNLPGMRDVGGEFKGVKHNALADAINQARHLQAINKALRGKVSA